MNKTFLIVLFAISNIIIASALIRYSEVGPVATFGYRLLIPAFILFIATRHTKKKTSNFTPKARFFAIIAGIAFGCDFIFFSNSLIFTSITEANLLANLCPFIVTIFAVVFLKERIPTKYILALILAMVGIVILMTQANLSHEHLLGNIFAIIATIFYSLYIIIW